MNPEKNQWTRVGVVTIAYSVAVVPFSMTTLKLTHFVGTQFRMVPLTLHSVVTAAFFTYILLNFKNLLNRRFYFVRIDLPILCLTTVACSSAAISVFALATTFGPNQLDAFNRTFPFTTGMLGILYSIRLLSFSRNLGGLMQAYSYVFLVQSTAAVFEAFIPAGHIFAIANQLLGVVSGVLLGVVFLRVADEGHYDADCAAPTVTDTANAESPPIPLP